jgi:hypothetical protein
MISRWLRLTIALAAIALTPFAHADMYVVVARGSTIMPSQSSEITMDSEKVVVAVGSKAEDDGFSVTAEFVLRNTSDNTIACDVAFPFETEREARDVHDTFKVAVDAYGSTQVLTGIELKRSGKPAGTEKSPYDFPAALTWRHVWHPHETKVVHISYVMGQPEQYHGIVEGWRLRYLVRTGALWKGPIGHADFTFRMKGNWLAEAFAESMPPRAKPAATNWSVFDPPYSYPANARREGPYEVRWHFDNWIPAEDIWLGDLGWPGFSEKPSRFLYWSIWAAAQAYTGATRDYTDARLDKIVDDCFAPWRDYFPSEAKRDRDAMKSLVAEWMFHEIFARRGDGFYIGKETKGTPPPLDAQGTSDGNYISEWAERFPRTNVRFTSWYKPNTGPGPHGRVRMRDLTDQERKNAEFLLHYFTPHCSCHPTLE